jgi:RNA polymerase sigma-70 factor (ECF subfamily)
VDHARRRDARQRRNDTLAAAAVGLFAPAGDPDEAAFRRELEAALAELPVEQRAVVHLKLWEGLTFDAIADALDIPLNTAASRYRYGLDKLRTRLRPLYDEIR